MLFLYSESTEVPTSKSYLLIEKQKERVVNAIINVLRWFQWLYTSYYYVYAWFPYFSCLYNDNKVDGVNYSEYTHVLYIWRIDPQEARTKNTGQSSFKMLWNKSNKEKDSCAKGIRTQSVEMGLRQYENGRYLKYIRSWICSSSVCVGFFQVLRFPPHSKKQKQNTYWISVQGYWMCQRYINK